MKLKACATAEEPETGPPPFTADWALFLDVDGTLLELAARPDQVVVRPGLIRLLDALQRAAGGAVALISGRAISDLDRLFEPLRLPSAGQHGIERRGGDGRLHRHHGLEDKLHGVRARLAQLAADHPGLIIEDKGFSLAVHYRGAPQLEALVYRFLEECMPGLEEDFRLQQGKMICEIRPGGRDKGMAVAEFMQEPPFRRRTPVFIGDDVTDEDGFRTVNAMHGHAIKVGAGTTAAAWRLADSAAVLAMLEAWLSFIGNPGEAARER